VAGGLKMTRISELSVKGRLEMVRDISSIMKFNYNIDRESVTEFWDTFVIGMEMRTRA